MRYHLKIEDCGSDGSVCGEALSVIAEGSYIGGELLLKYVYDGADYSLIIGENYVVHKRFGDTQMFLEFRSGQYTDGVIKSGGMSGNLRIYTHELKILLTANGCNARIAFSDGANSGGELIKNVTAYAVK